MDDGGDNKRRKHPRRKRWTVVGVVLAPVVLMLVVVGSLYVLSRGSVEERLAAIRAAGYPTNLAELKEYIKLPEGVENAASVYDEAFSSFVPPGSDVNVPLFAGVELPERGEPLPEATVEAISEFLAENEKCLGLLRKAGGIEHCRYEWDYATAQLPRLMELRQCAGMLELAAVFHAHKGDDRAGAAFMKDGLRLADSLEGEPLLINHLVRVSCTTLPIRGLELSLGETSLADEQLRDLSDAILETAGSINLAEALVTDQCYILENISKPGGPGGFGGNWRLDLPIIRKTGLIDYLDYMANCIEAAKLAGTQRIARFREIHKEIEELSFLHALIKVVAPSMARIAELDLEVDVRLKLAQTAIAVERSRLAKGELPGRLAELVGEYLEEVPVDPFDDKPIKYKRIERGYLLYSVGMDGKDDGGKERRAKKQPGESCDLTFIVTR